MQLNISICNAKLDNNSIKSTAVFPAAVLFWGEAVQKHSAQPPNILYLCKFKRNNV